MAELSVLTDPVLLGSGEEEEWSGADEEIASGEENDENPESRVSRRRLRRHLSEISVQSTQSDTNRAHRTSFSALPSAEVDIIESVLRQVCLKGDEKLVHNFLYVGFCGQEEDEVGFNSLHYAASRGNAACCQLLLSAGVSINSMSHDHHTPLYVAAQSGHVQAVSVLLSAGANPDISTLSTCHTAVHVAAENDHTEVVRMLLEAGTSATAMTQNGFTPLHLACQHGNLNVVDLILSMDCGKQCIEMKNKDGFTPLLLCAWHGHPECCHSLLKAGADINATNQAGRSALILAALKHPRVVDVCLKFNPNVLHCETQFGWSALHAAAIAGDSELGQQLLKAGCDVHQKDKMHRTPLWLAAQQGHKDMLTILLQAGAKVNPKSKTGRTPLMVARAANYTEIVKELLDALMATKFSREVRIDSETIHERKTRGKTLNNLADRTSLTASLPSTSDDVGLDTEESDAFDAEEEGHWEDRRRRRVRMAQRHISWSREDAIVRRRQTMIAQLKFTKEFGKEMKPEEEEKVTEESTEPGAESKKPSQLTKKKSMTLPRGMHFVF